MKISTLPAIGLALATVGMPIETYQLDRTTQCPKISFDYSVKIPLNAATATNPTNPPTTSIKGEFKVSTNYDEPMLCDVSLSQTAESYGDGVTDPNRETRGDLTKMRPAAVADLYSGVKDFPTAFEVTKAAITKALLNPDYVADPHENRVRWTETNDFRSNNVPPQDTPVGYFEIRSMTKDVVADDVWTTDRQANVSLVEFEATCYVKYKPVEGRHSNFCYFDLTANAPYPGGNFNPSELTVGYDTEIFGEDFFGNSCPFTEPGVIQNPATVRAALTAQFPEQTRDKINPDEIDQSWETLTQICADGYRDIMAQ